MTVADALFDKATIELALGAVAARLEAQGAEPGVLIVVGGSFMALHQLREATRDVDTVTRITAAIRDALNAVAAAHGFEADWLNDRAVIYVPQGLVEEACEVLLDHPRLRVLGPPTDYVFAMKLYAARGEVDHDDMVLLWPRCTFTTPDEAVALYWEAYPHAPRTKASPATSSRSQAKPPASHADSAPHPSYRAPYNRAAVNGDLLLRRQQRSWIVPFTTTARTATDDRESRRTSRNADRKIPRTPAPRGVWHERAKPGAGSNCVETK